MTEDRDYVVFYGGRDGDAVTTHRVEFTVPFLGRLLTQLSGKEKRWGLLGTLAAVIAALYFLEDRLRHM